MSTETVTATELLDYNAADIEECNACYALDDQCPYHRGAADGIEWLASKVARLADDPELGQRIPDPQVRGEDR